MGARYAIDLKRTASTTLPVGSFGASSTTSTRGGKVAYLAFGQEGTTGDAAYLWEIWRYTAAGTSTAVVPQALNPASAAFLGVAGENHTVDATRTAASIMYSVGLHQKETHQWYAEPGGEIFYPATNANGLAVMTTTAPNAVAITAYFQVEEL